jgi:hypothetical protein
VHERGRRLRTASVDRLGQAEIEHFHRAVGSHLHIRRLEVAVHDALRVSGVERVGDLARDRERLVQRHRAFGDEVGKRGSFHELHHEGAAVAGSFEAVDGRDVGMIERRERFGLAREARHAVGILLPRRRQDLDRHVTAKVHVGGAVHFAHPTGADQGGDFIRAESSPWHERHDRPEYTYRRAARPERGLRVEG